MRKKKNRTIFSQFDTDSIDLDQVIVDTDSVESVADAENSNVSQTGNDNHENGSDSDQSGDLQIPSELGILALRNAIVFPGTVMPLAVGRPKSRLLLDQTLPRGKTIGVLTQINSKTEDPKFGDLYQVGSVVSLLKMLKMPDGQNSLVVHGLTRFRVVKWRQADPYLMAKIEVLTSQLQPSKKLDATVNGIRQMAHQMIQLTPNIPEEVNVVINNIEDPGALADFLAANINISVKDKQEILETIDVNKRLKILSLAMAAQIELLELSDKIQSKVSKSIDKTQREYYLQEQLKVIQTELGHLDQKAGDIEELREMITNTKMPEKVEHEAFRELDRLSKIPTMSPEFSVHRSYIEWLCELPWSKSTRDKLSQSSARRILNADHYGLAKVKKRILEFLAVRKLNPAGRSPILCFVGPPGVGKTSLGKSIARSMGRKFSRISLGGIRDEADIRGHRRTYIGALPGRIIQELRKCESNNPVFMLDEIDKIGQDFRGDPASALLEVLDPEQNSTFNDHYIDQPFDLSRVMFIATANYMGTVPPALLDRMEVLELPGYSSIDKLAIAKRYLLPRQLKENGLSATILNIKDDALEHLIESYTREAGVRELERKIAAVCRGVAAQVASRKRKTATVSAKSLSRYLGPILYESELALRTSMPGVATGLAYTPAGGEVLFIESTLIPGTGKLILTGQLGDVMKESAQAALTLLKGKAIDKKAAKKNGPHKKLFQTLADGKYLKEHDIHIHVPAGAVSKDGPSAGLAMYTSLASVISDIPVRANVAMTGEITLRGLVLPIGGVKEKVLAAKRAGIRTVILPEKNRKDLQDIPKHVLKSMKFEFTRHVDKILKLTLEN